MDTQDVDFDVAKQFWAAANLVVGFSLAQTVGFALAAGSVSGRLDEHIQAHYYVALAFTVFSAIASVGVVAFCQSTHRAIMSTLPKSPTTTIGLRNFDRLRIAATAVAGLSTVVLIAAIEWTPKEPPAPPLQVTIMQHLPASK